MAPFPMLPGVEPLVLVVDDNDANRFAKIQTVRRAGFRVLEAATGRRALELAGEHPIDLVLLDINLPDISGVEVCGRIKSNGALTAVQVLQVSATAISNEDRVRGLTGGADGYLVEPVDPQLLVATLQALMRVRRAELALVEALQRERAAREAAEQADAAKDQFLATLSHELRTPLNAMIGWIALLRSGAIGEDGKMRALDSLDRSARTQWRMVNELLDTASIASGKLQLDKAPMDLAGIAAAAADTMADEAARAEVTLEAELQSVPIEGDQQRIEQVVLNLLTNAIRHTPPGGLVQLTVGCAGREAMVRVVDTGVGIEPDFMPHLFERFRQGTKTQQMARPGLGLGLAISRHIVELHGGRITAESAGADHGAVFTVLLPLGSTPV
jgi:signal transduction histidine kinase